MSSAPFFSGLFGGVGKRIPHDLLSFFLLVREFGCTLTLVFSNYSFLFGKRTDTTHK